MSIFGAINLASQVAYNPVGQGVGYALFLILERARLLNQTRFEKEVRFETITGASKAIFARLGEIEFLMVEGLTGFREQVRQRIAIHETAVGKEALQPMGAGIREISLSATFHQFFGDPQSRLEALRAACEDGKARKLAFGNGVYDGEFVIESVETTVMQCAPNGDVIWATADMRLKEHVDKEVLALEKKPKQKPALKSKKTVLKAPASFVPVVRGRPYPYEQVPLE